MSSSRLILVTGANRGIGFSIIQALATHTPSDHFLLGCRDLDKGKSAITSLRSLGITSPITPIQLDVTSDTSLRAAVQTIETNHSGKLDVLINNAGIAVIPSSSLSDFSDHRAAYTSVFDTNVTSVAMSMSFFLPLLRNSTNNPKILNISSTRGSITLNAYGALPPTVAVTYGVSKTALNSLTVDFSRAKGNEGVQFQCVSPGFCKTKFNGWKGLRDPLEGANVVVEMVHWDEEEKGEFPDVGLWGTEGAGRELVRSPW